MQSLIGLKNVNFWKYTVYLNRYYKFTRIWQQTYLLDPFKRTYNSYNEFQRSTCTIEFMTVRHDSRVGKFCN